MEIAVPYENLLKSTWGDKLNLSCLQTWLSVALSRFKAAKLYLGEMIVVQPSSFRIGVPAAETTSAGDSTESIAPISNFVSGEMFLEIRVYDTNKTVGLRVARGLTSITKLYAKLVKVLL